MNSDVALVWFRSDLRLAGNPALAKAIASKRAIVPVFIWAPDHEAPWQAGAASRWWLHQSLWALDGALRERGSRLIVTRGPIAELLSILAKECSAASVFWNRRYEPAAIQQEIEVERRLRGDGIATESCPGNLLFQPGTILNNAGKPFQVFTAFWRACQAQPNPPQRESVSARIPAPSKWPDSVAVSDLELEPRIDWTAGLRETWKPGEAGAAQRLEAFLQRGLEAYAADRDRPDHTGTSRLSPYLHFGEISAREVWRRAREQAGTAAAEAYIRQLAWREFSYHLLFHFPRTAQEPLHGEFRDFPWRVDERGFKAWTHGRTGYPLVDAGMRELWRTGWMHNRVRMVVASFLVKHLMIPWQEGASWFWDTLVDADLANNTMGWQWAAGCGADAAPYFRVFNPVKQGQRFDADGTYIRRWVPELAGIPNRWIHAPWEAPPLVLGEARITLGKDYPKPIVEHESARTRALAAFRRMRDLHGQG